MINIDKEIEALGYEIRTSSLSCSYIIYENKQQDQEVIIEWGDEEEQCQLFSQTISKTKDWFGQSFQMGQALTIRELEIFAAKINEMRKTS